MAISRKILTRIKTAPDQELHVTKVRIHDQEAIELRHYIPSAKRYGRGIPLDKRVFVQLVQEDGPEIIDRLWPKGVPSPDQEELAV